MAPEPGDAVPASLFRPLREVDRSQADQRVRRTVRQAQPPPDRPFNPHAAVTRGTRALRHSRVYARLSIPRHELIAQASTLADSFYAELIPGAGQPVQEQSASARKNLTTAYGICFDKLQALLGRPAEPLVTAEAPQRASILGLGARLAALAPKAQSTTLP